MSGEIVFNLGSPCADDLRAAGFVVAAHYDGGSPADRYTVWLLTIEVMDIRVALRGSGKTDAEALDQIRREFSRRWEKR